MRIRGAAFVLLAIALSLPGAAQAVPASSCGGAWAGTPTSCYLEFKGFPLTVSGSATSATLEAVTVRLVIESTASAQLPGVVVLACAAARAGSGNIGCEESVGPDLPAAIPVGTRLVCHVAGLDSGTFSCSSGPDPENPA